MEGLCEGLGRFGSVDIVNFGRFTKGFRRFAIRFAKVCGLENVRNLLSCSSRAMCFIGFVLVQVDDVACIACVSQVFICKQPTCPPASQWVS